MAKDQENPLFAVYLYAEAQLELLTHNAGVVPSLQGFLVAEFVALWEFARYAWSSALLWDTLEGDWYRVTNIIPLIALIPPSAQPVGLCWWGLLGHWVRNASCVLLIFLTGGIVYFSYSLSWRSNGSIPCYLQWEDCSNLFFCFPFYNRKKVNQRNLIYWSVTTVFSKGQKSCCSFSMMITKTINVFLCQQWEYWAQRCLSSCLVTI